MCDDRIQSWETRFEGAQPSLSYLSKRIESPVPTYWVIIRIHRNKSLDTGLANEANLAPVLFGVQQWDACEKLAISSGFFRRKNT